MAPLKELKSLVRLHRSGEEYAEENLRRFIAADPENVAKALGIDPAKLDGSARQVVQCLKYAHEHSRAKKLGEARVLCDELARKIARGQVRHEHGIGLPIEPVRELALLGGYPYARFVDGERTGTVDLTRLGRVFRQCAGTNLRAIDLTSTHMQLRYDTPHSRGRIALVVGRVYPAQEDMVIIDLTPKPKPMRATCPSAPQPAHLPASRHGGFWGHVINALQQAIP